MKLGSMSSLSVASALALCVAGVFSSNASAVIDGVNNGGFESSAVGTELPDNGGAFDQWNSYYDPTHKWAISSAQAHSGSNSATNGISGGGLYQIDRVATPATDSGLLLGQTVSWSFWAYDAGATGDLSFQVQVRNDDNVPLNGNATTLVTAADAADGAWTQYTGSYVVGTTVQTPPTSRVVVQVTSASAAGTWFIDDVNVAVTPEPTSIAALGLLGTLARRRRA